MDGSWIAFDFKYMRIVEPTYYLIKTYADGPDHLRSWVLEHFAGGKWITIDWRENTEFLNHRGVIKTFSMLITTEVSRVRLRLNGPNHSSRLSLVTAAFGIFVRLENSRFVPFGQNDGIIAFFTHKLGWNVHNGGIVTVSAASTAAGSPAKAAMDDSATKFISGDDPISG
jgi:hypothetical protein